MIPQLFVLDEFLPNPHAVCRKALTLDYSVPGGFPGGTDHGWSNPATRLRNHRQPASLQQAKEHSCPSAR